MNGQENRSESYLNRVGYGPAILGIAAFAALGAAYTSGDKAGVLQSYLFGFICIALVVLGCLGLTLLHHTVRGQWGLPLLRIWEAGGGPAAIVMLGVLFLPIAFGMGTVYKKWLDPQYIDHIVVKKQAWLNESRFLIFAAAYFIIWFILAAVLRASSLREDKTRDPKEASKRTNLAAPGIAIFIVLVNFATTDWVMSLDPHWFSTLYGLWFVVGMALTAMAVSVLFVVGSRMSAEHERYVEVGWTRDVGNLLLTMTMLWAYLTLSQFLIIYSANLKEFIPFYLARSHGGWNVVAVVLVLGQFFVPFLALLAPRTKATPRLLMLVAILIIAMRVLDMFWNVIPFFRPDGLVVTWTDLVALLGFIGVWLSVFGSQIKKASLLPTHDPRIHEVLEHA